jgi:beta-barrel assembly-enhancing protease
MPIFSRRESSRPRSRMGGRLIIAVILGLVAVGSYFAIPVSTNPVTGTRQRLALTVPEEIALGLQAAPDLAQQFGGELPDAEAQSLVDRLGAKLVASVPGEAAQYPFDFHVLADNTTVNAFALPGGQVFITAALLGRMETEGQLAGVLGHEVGHVVGRHSAAQMAKSQLFQGLTGAVAVGSYDPEHPSSQVVGIAAAMASQMITLKYGRNDELEADRIGVRLTTAAGYDPSSLIRVMEILKEAGGRSTQPEFMNSHPDPGNRIEHIKRAIAEEFPSGVPPGLTP